MTQQPDPVQTDPANPPSGDPPASTNPAEQTFTQDQINAMLAAEKRQTEAKVRGEYADYGTLKKESDELATIKHNQLTESQKLEEDKTAAETRAKDAESKLANQGLEFAIQNRAVELGAVDGSSVLAMIDRSGITVGEDGKLAGVDEAVNALLEARSYLKRANTPAPNVNPGGNPAPGSITLSADQMEAANKMGQSYEDYAKGLAGT